MYTLLRPDELRTLALTAARRARRSDMLQLPELPF
jgi:hypothetical protein